MLASAALSGCAIPGAVMVGGLATGTYLGVQERGAKTAMVDTKIKTHIKDRLTGLHYSYLTGVGVSVLEGEVLLTGVLPDSTARPDIVRTVRETEGVKKVYDELVIGKTSTAERAQDTWLGTQIKARFAGAKNVYAINYITEVVQGEVYVLGLVGSQSELEQVLHIARTTKGVKVVHNYLRMSETPKHHIPSEAPSALPENEEEPQISAPSEAELTE